MLAQAQARILDRKYGVDKSIPMAAMVADSNQRGVVRWDNFAFEGVAHEKLEKVPAPQARYESLPATLTDVRRFSSLKTDFADWVYRSAKVTVRVNPALKVWVGPDASTADFRKACSDAARAARNAEYNKVVASLEKQIVSLQRRLEKEQLELKADQEALAKRSWEEMQTVADNVLGIFRKGKVRRLTRAVEKNRLRGQTEADVEESKMSVAQLEEQIAGLSDERARREQEINARWADVADDMTEVPLTPKKSDIFIEHFGVAWMPFYLVKSANGVIELPAFGG
jgi:hypothetical protein